MNGDLRRKYIYTNGDLRYPWMEDVMQVLSEIKDPAMRKLAIDQLKCIARIS